MVKTLFIRHHSITMTRPELLVGWELLSQTQQMNIKQMLPPNFTSYLSKNDVAKLASKQRGKKNRNNAVATAIKVESVPPPKLLAQLQTKFHNFIKRDKDALPKLDLVKLDSFVNCVPKRCNGEDASKDANEAWQAAIKMLIVCKIKKELPLKLCKQELPIDLSKKGLDCCTSLSARHHTVALTALVKWWRKYCIWTERENAERSQLKQYIEFAKLVREQKGDEYLESKSEFNVVIFGRLELISKSQTMQAKTEQKLNKMTDTILKRRQ